jgi:hypothetical protein
LKSAFRFMTHGNIKERGVGGRRTGKSSRHQVRNGEKTEKFRVLE